MFTALMKLTSLNMYYAQMNLESITRPVWLTPNKCLWSDGKVLKSEDVIVPKFTAIGTNDGDEATIYSVVSSIVCLILIVVLLVNM